MKQIYYFIAAFVCLLISFINFPGHETLLWVTYGLIFIGAVSSGRKEKTKPNAATLAVGGVVALLGLFAMFYFSGVPQ